MEWNGFMIGTGIKEIWAIKGVTPTSGNPVWDATMFLISRKHQTHIVDFKDVVPDEGVIPCTAHMIK